MAFVPTHPVLTAEQKVKIVRELEKRSAMRQCARCGVANFTLLDNIFEVSPIAVAPIGWPAQVFPAIGIVCTNCGSIHYHLLGLLLPLEEFGFVR